jgi:hypothetical protein
MRLFKFLINTSLILCFTGLYAQTKVGMIKIPESHKNISQVSGKFNDSITFHLLINKNKDTKRYESDLVFFGETEKIKTIKIIEHEEKPKYSAFNVNDNILTFINEINDEIQIYDVDFKSETIQKVKGLLKPFYIFSSDQHVLFIYSSSRRYFDFALIKNTKEVFRKNYSSKSSAFNQSFPEINSDNSILVDNDDFIHKGFINEVKLFYSKTSLYALSEHKWDDIVKVVRYKFNGESEVNFFKVGNGDKIKQLNAFISNDLLFTFCMHKKIAQLDIYNLNSSQLMKSISYSPDEFEYFNQIIKNGEDKTEDFNAKRFYNSFFSPAIGSTYNGQLYIGVNQTTDKGYDVEVGHVDKNTFSFPSNSLTNTEGLILSGQMMVYEMFASAKRRGNYFKIHLDEDLNFVKESPKLKHKDYVDRLKKVNTWIENSYEIRKFNNKNAMVPLENFTRFINYSGSDDSYILYNFSSRKF